MHAAIKSCSFVSYATQALFVMADKKVLALRAVYKDFVDDEVKLLTQKLETMREKRERACMSYDAEIARLNEQLDYLWQFVPEGIPDGISQELHR